jgi:ABC-type lipoprotein export system ATPase subunit
MQDTHFLRPALTKHIIQRLQRGESLNLFGKPGIGKTRMLEDIRDAKIDKTFVIIVFFRGYHISIS